MRFLIACLIFIALAHLGLATPASLAPLSPNDECPAIDFRPLKHVCVGDKVEVEASVKGISSDIKPTYYWTVSTGTITSGQGTDTITIDTTNVADDVIYTGLKATVTVGGLNGSPQYCSREASFSERVVFCGRAIKFDEFGDASPENEKEHLDSLAMELENKEYMTALVFVYAGKRARFGEAEARLIRARNYLVNKRHVPEDRIVTLDGGYREALTFEVWTLPPRTPPVKPSPTVDFANVEIIDGPVNSTYP